MALAVVAVLVLGVAAVAGLLGSSAVATVSLSAAILLLAYGGRVLDNAVLIQGRRRSALAVRNLLGGLLVATLQVGGALLTGSAVVIALGVLVGRLLAIALTWTPVSATALGRSSLSLRGSLLSVGSQSIWVLSMQTPDAAHDTALLGGGRGVRRRRTTRGRCADQLARAGAGPGVAEAPLAPHVREPRAPCVGRCCGRWRCWDRSRRCWRWP